MAFSCRPRSGAGTTNPVDYSPHVIEDRELITGQNPRSDHPITVKLLDALKRARWQRPERSVVIVATMPRLPPAWSWPERDGQS
jgi:hypothetical protein